MADNHEEPHEDVTVNSDVIQEEVATLLRMKFGQEVWNPRKVDSWVDDVVDSVLKNLTDLKKPFKFVVSCVIMQRTGAAISTGFISLWDNTFDGVVHVPYENETLHCFVTVFFVKLD
ncbi:dynein light chain Tctex-type, putative [Trypanosoma equiperdum]|uniref:Dynein light chain, putative n=4 Tax=Trypanozoon TaxID=39700 RepID=Q386E6_TRYB2|nr:dynein light chain, putative [Trypanosoma brucei gambiense DAL972]XP_828447.1 dynein light chain, putative [Trypanosoma brucei brucei TREU927]RHW68384.1 dynein light chain Tctex-type [Trypanosoma brucei equiperdum]SCU68172.1 dynein light chain Tctex-type, putative [Trypanosoma equiperdum]EAN79335.1 dynein light chain, putative [Trypanosoma brucei brucei TREU927]CBH17300.1 dynein light chain, putative [Trypanosoma brucei gambiense DAL972]|eukprot:XP_011779564.1 dynein light chain, putative [Trypanosoma brucei gambiense DAL972]